MEEFLSEEDVEWYVEQAEIIADSSVTGQVVYFIEGAEGRVRIGTSQNLKRRYDHLQAGSPVNLFFIKITPGDERLEQLIHDTLQRDKIRSSWYRKTGMMYQLIQCLPNSKDHVNYQWTRSSGLTRFIY